MITDANGNILYTDRSVKISGALHLFASAAAKSNKNGLVYYKGKSVYTKEIILGGKRLRFFMDSQNLCKYLGIEANVLDGEMFDIPKAFKNRVPVSLQSLVHIFTDAYSKELFNEGVRMSVRHLAAAQTVNVSPNAFAICLAIMVRLCANEASEVTLTFANECGRVSIYADSVGGVALDKAAKEVLQTMLYEISAAAGFTASENVHAVKRTFSLELEPLDIATLGFKAPSLDKYEQLVKLYIEMFL